MVQLPEYSPAQTLMVEPTAAWSRAISRVPWFSAKSTEMTPSSTASGSSQSFDAPSQISGAPG